MKKILASSTVATIVMTGAALAQSKPGATPVPEINAYAGVAAVAVLAAVVALIWERRRAA